MALLRALPPVVILLLLLLLLLSRSRVMTWWVGALIMAAVRRSRVLRARR
jgi:hypothetical protein